MLDVASFINAELLNFVRVIVFNFPVDLFIFFCFVFWRLPPYGWFLELFNDDMLLGALGYLRHTHLLVFFGEHVYR